MNNDQLKRNNKQLKGFLPFSSYFIACATTKSIVFVLGLHLYRAILYNLFAVFYSVAKNGNGFGQYVAALVHRKLQIKIQIVKLRGYKRNEINTIAEALFLYLSYRLLSRSALQ